MIKFKYNFKTSNMSIYENFMEDALFYHQLKQEQQLREWSDLIEQEQKAYDIQAEQYFKDLKEYETSMLEKEYRTIKEWEDLVTI